MPFLYQDKNWIAVNKPSGIATHGAYKGDIGLVEWLQLHYEKTVYICSRLDKETSGVLLFALTPQAVAEAQKIHEGKRARKDYYFVAGSIGQSTWECRQDIDGKACRTHFIKIQEGAFYTLYKAEIHRGRTHQIRRHAAASGVPLLGDTQYGGDSFVRVCLHCATVSWPDIQQKIEVTLPGWFKALPTGITAESIALALAEKRYPFLDTISDCCRLIHRGEFADADMAVDKYGEWLCVTGFDESVPAKQLLCKLDRVLTALLTLDKIRGGIVKTNLRDPHKRKLYADIATWGQTIPDSFLVREHDVHFGVKLNQRQHVGLFLDLRDCRRRIAQVVKDKRVANLFAFTCSFSMYALAAGAEVVFSVDLAAGCLKQGRENAEANQLAGDGRARFIKEDVRKWLARQLRRKENDPQGFSPFDVVICDPPVFAGVGKGKSFHVEKEWPNLARDIAAITTENGIALFSNNHQAGSESLYYETLQLHFSTVRRLDPPLDFPQVAGRSSHVRIYWCRK